MDWIKKAPFWVTVEDKMEAAHAPVAGELLKQAALIRGRNVLDIGCGSGGTALAIARSVGVQGTVTGIDIAPAMIARAKTRVDTMRHVGFVTGNAQDYAFEAGGFDSALSMFGVMFFENPVAAFANIRKSVRPLGPLAFAAWGPGKDNPWFSYLRAATELHLGPLAPPDPGAPGPMAFADTDHTLGILRSAGWHKVCVDTIELHLTPKGTPADIADLIFRLSPTTDIIKTQTDSAQKAAQLEQAVIHDLARALEGFQSPSGVLVPARVHFYTAINPEGTRAL